MSHPRRAVYTALMGRYEKLREQPMAARSTIPFICFTDDPTLTSTTWTIRVVEPAFADDPVRSARLLKILGDEYLADFDETLWIDNRVELIAVPEIILDDWLHEADLALIRHSFRSRLAEEFGAVVHWELDDPNRIQSQALHYARRAHHILNHQPLWTGIIARRPHAVRATMDAWFDEVTTWSRRDQLSITLALDDTKPAHRLLDRDNLESEWHRWPLVDDSLQRTMRPPVAHDQSPDHVLSQALARTKELNDHRAAVREHPELVATLRFGIDRDWIRVGEPKSRLLSKNRRGIHPLVPLRLRTRYLGGRILRRLKILPPITH